MELRMELRFELRMELRMERAMPTATTTRDSTTCASATTRLLRRFHHLASAGLLGVFVLLHLGKHAAGLVGQELHRKVQVWVRLVHQGWMEPIPLLSCLIQLATGLRLAAGRRPKIPASWRHKRPGT